MFYSIKEMAYTLQGEGVQTGRPAVFCRFAGCNLWNGHEEDRAAAVCRICDTDIRGTDGPGGGRFPGAPELAAAVASLGPADNADWRPLVVCTGGEPLLQLDPELVQEFHARGFEVAVETNGTFTLPCPVDWVTVSPKPGAELVQREGDELKLVYPQPGLDPEEFTALEFRHFILQPLDAPGRESHIQAAIRYCLEHPAWRLGLQTHKFLGIP